MGHWFLPSSTLPPLTETVIFAESQNGWVGRDTKATQPHLPSNPVVQWSILLSLLQGRQMETKGLNCALFCILVWFHWCHEAMHEAMGRVCFELPSSQSSGCELEKHSSDSWVWRELSESEAGRMLWMLLWNTEDEWFPVGLASWACLYPLLNSACQ